MNTKVTLKLITASRLDKITQIELLDEIKNSTYVKIKKIFVLFFEGNPSKVSNWCIYVYSSEEKNLASFYYYGIDQNVSEEEESAILNFEGVLHSEIVKRVQENNENLTTVIKNLLKNNIEKLYDF